MCSLVHMSKTTIHQTASNFETIIFSGGKIGFQIELRPDDLAKVIKFSMADIIK